MIEDPDNRGSDNRGCTVIVKRILQIIAFVRNKQFDFGSNFFLQSCVALSSTATKSWKILQLCKSASYAEEALSQVMSLSLFNQQLVLP